MQAIVHAGLTVDGTWPVRTESAGRLIGKDTNALAPTIWECVQHTARALNAEGGGDLAAARLIREMGGRAADARALLDRLFRIATEKGWAAEALVYNQLAEEWPHLLEMASNPDSAAPVGATPDLLG